MQKSYRKAVVEKNISLQFVLERQDTYKKRFENYVYLRAQKSIMEEDIIELRNIDSEDISDVLVKLEKSFNFKFGKNELENVSNFGELCNIITNKINGDDLKDCTSQQAFYKLRNAIARGQCIDKKDITPDTDLKILFPRNKRRKKIAVIERNLGFKIKILRPKHWLTNSFILIFLISLPMLFFYWQAGLAGLFFSIIGLKLAQKFGNEFDLKNIGEVAEKISRENYLKARRNPETINKNEIKKKIKELFRNDLILQESVLKDDAVFG